MISLATSGPEVASIFQRFGFFILSERGSQIKLRRINQAGEKQTLTVPNHRQLDTGTCHYISPDDLRPFFYAD